MLIITLRLIGEKAFKAVAIEGDWPDAYRVHHLVRGSGKDENAREGLGDFTLSFLDVAQHRPACLRGLAANSQ